MFTIKYCFFIHFGGLHLQSLILQNNNFYKKKKKNIQKNLKKIFQLNCKIKISKHHQLNNRIQNQI